MQEKKGGKKMTRKGYKMPEDEIIYSSDLSKLKRENLLRTMEIVRNGGKRFIERLNELLPALQATKKRLQR